MTNSKTAQYLRHITLNTAHSTVGDGTHISQATRDTVREWLTEAIQAQEIVPLPAIEGYQARVFQQGGGLLVSVYCQATPLVTFAVAGHSRHSAGVWDALLKSGLADYPRKPRAPWLAVVLHDTLALHMDATEWLGDFEQCCAWAWIA